MTTHTSDDLSNLAALLNASSTPQEAQRTPVVTPTPQTATVARQEAPVDVTVPAGLVQARELARQARTEAQERQAQADALVARLLRDKRAELVSHIRTARRVYGPNSQEARTVRQGAVDAARLIPGPHRASSLLRMANVLERSVSLYAPYLAKLDEDTRAKVLARQGTADTFKRLASSTLF